MLEIWMIVLWKMFVKSIFLGLEQQNTRILECSFCLQPHPRTGWLLLKAIIFSQKAFKLHKSGTDHSVYDIRFCWLQFSIWIRKVSPFQRSLLPGGLMGDHQDERLLGLRHEATVLGGVLRETRHVGKSWFLLLWSPINIHNLLAYAPYFEKMQVLWYSTDNFETWNGRGDKFYACLGQASVPYKI